MRRIIACSCIAAILCTLLCVQAFALEMPEGSYITNVTSGWSTTPSILNESFYQTTSLERNFNRPCNGQVDFITTYQNVPGVVYFGLSPLYNNDTFNGYIYFQFEIGITHVAGQSLTGNTQPVKGLISNSSHTLGTIQFDLVDIDNTYIMTETIQTNQGRTRITVGINCNHYSNKKTIGCAVSYPAQSAVVVGIDFNNVVIMSGDPLPNADNLLSNISDSLDSIHGDLNGINTTLGEFMEQSAEQNQQINIKLDNIEEIIENQTQTEFDWYTDKFDEITQDLDIGKFGDWGDKFDDYLSSARSGIELLTDMLVRTDAETSITIPEIVVPALGVDEAWTLYEGGEIDLSDLLESDPIQLLIGFSKGCFYLYFFYWCIKYLIFIYNCIFIHDTGNASLARGVESGINRYISDVRYEERKNYRRH